MDIQFTLFHLLKEFISIYHYTLDCYTMLTYALTDVQCHIENTLKHITRQCFVRLNVGDLPQRGISKPKLRHLVIWSQDLT
jgi:hypothetical protein